MPKKSDRKMVVIQSELRKEILGGKWEVGNNLPNEVELARRFDCSAGTVNKAVTLLVHEGLVIRRNRMGTKVISNTLKNSGYSIDLDAVAVIYPSDKHSGLWRSINGIQDEAREQGRRVVMLATGSDYGKEKEYIQRLQEFDVRGAVLYPVINSAKEQLDLWQLILDSKFKIVLLGAYFLGLDCPAVVLDGFHAGYTMTRHLLDQGLRRVGFFSNQAAVSPVRDSYRGYCWAIEEAGLPVDRGLIFHEQESHADFEDPLREVTLLAKNYLHKTHDVQGVVCADDYLALGMISAAREAGLNVPRDLKVTGVSDDIIGYNSQPALTTYRSHPEAMGRAAFELLNETILRKTDCRMEVQIRGEIVIRESA